MVNLPMADVREMLQQGLATKTLLEFKIARGFATERVIVNPLQVKVLQTIRDADAA